MRRKMAATEKVYLIAELGVNHEGDVKVAEDVIARLEGSGASAIKLQSFTPERYVSASDKNRLQRVRAFALDLEAHKHLREKAHRSGLDFISTPVSEDWVEPLSELCDALKIASGDIDFAPTIKAAALTDLPVIMSTGTAEIEEVDAAVALFKSVRKVGRIEDHLHLMHCISEYPARIENCNLRSIPFMSERYGLNVGWSNHVIGSLACHAAISLGADIIEVHVTDQKEGREFRDHALSFEPDEISVLVSELNAIKSGLGSLNKAPTLSEKKNTLAFRKGLIFSRDLKSGSIIEEQDIMFARPATHFSSNQKDEVTGRKLCQDVKSGHLIAEELLS
ncbi:MAG: hypothetical protein CBB97_02360 [Candidatus Endolissoclinum sp. TMED37]|nr:MAG: hypothetical protein CBB97_02360 [Candidatus Endolissoclinum sp. TMED37]